MHPRITAKKSPFCKIPYPSAVTWGSGVASPTGIGVDSGTGTDDGVDGVVGVSSGSEKSPRNSAFPYNGASMGKAEVSASPPRR